MAITLVTFGGLSAIDDSGELDLLLNQHSRAALFVYLAVEQRVARETLTTVFWPESDAENARHALRQSLYQLRKVVGRDWVESRAQELVVADDVRPDTQSFTEAIGRNDFESVIALYRGPFLDGVHLVDLKPWESWVDAHRAQYARAFRKACRELLERRRAAGDSAGAIAVAERWISADPLDDEAQHRFIESLAAAGERTEAIRQFDTYARALEPDGLQPLDETSALAQQLRASRAPLPPIRLQPPPSKDAALGPTESTQARSKPHPRHRFVLPAFVGLVLVAGLSWTLIQRRVESAPRADATAVAVLPFSVRGNGSVGYLREGMVNLLSAALDGAGSIRPADTRAVLASAAAVGGSPDDTTRANRIASRVAAGMYVLGDVVEAGGRLQIDAAVYRRQAACSAPLGTSSAAPCRQGGPAAHATVTGSVDSVFALVDQLAARLLGGLGDPSADRLLRTASLATSSLAAFKAYLQGEESMRASRFEQAADAYQAAIAADSTFALAHYRLALAREWAPLPGEDEAAAAAARHAHRLSARDRALLEAFRQWRAGDAVAAERAYETLLARYPEDLDAWFQLGEIRFHHGPLRGHPINESETAWRKLNAHEPRSAFVATHLARIHAVSGDTAALDSVLAAFTPNELRDDRRLVELELLRAVARSDTARALSIAGAVKRWEPFAVWRASVWVAAFSPNTGLGQLVMQSLLDGYASPGLRADMLWFSSMLELAGGRLGASRAALAEAAASERTVIPGRRRDGFAEITEWFTATLPLPYAPAALAAARERASAARGSAEPLGGYHTELGLGSTIQREPIRHYTIGVLSMRLGDTASAVRAAESLRRYATSSGSTPLVRDLERGLRAHIAFEEGRADEALSILNQIETDDTQGDVAAVPFVSRVNERYLRGMILTSSGKHREALRWLAALGDGSASEIPLRALSHLRQGEIYMRINDRAEARRHLARAVALWSGADPELRGALDDARRRLAELER